MRRFSRLGLVLGLSLAVLGGVRRALHRNHGGARSRRPVLPRFHLLPEDGFGGPGVFERAVPPFEAPTSPVAETFENAPAVTASKTRARKTQATKPAVKKSAAKKSPAKKSSVKSSRPAARGSSRKG